MRNSSPRVVAVSITSVLKIIGLLLGLALVWQIRDIVLSLFTAVLLAGVMYPFVRWAERIKLPKSVAVIIFYVVMFGVLGLACALLVPALADQVSAFANTNTHAASSLLNDAMQAFKGYTDAIGVTGNLQSGLASLPGQIQDAVGGFAGALASLSGGLASMVVVLVLAFYIIIEESHVKAAFQNIIPQEYQDFASKLVWLMIDKLGGWLRGQLVLCLIIGILYFIGLSAAGVPYALLLALLGGVLEIIPYLGPIISAIPVAILAFSTGSPTRALAALLIILLIQQLENNVIVPKVMQKAVGLSPIVSIVAFMIGAQLFGIVGAIFSIPVATAASVALAELVRFRQGNA